MTRRDPEILELSTGENQLTARLEVPEDLEYFEGHFSFQPILPAVVQVGWVIDFARENLPLTGEPDQIENLKFRRKLKPGDRCTLSLDWQPEESLMTFDFRQDDERVSSGRVSVATDR